MIGLEYPGIHELLANSIKKADIDLRRTLYKEIVIAGGTTYLSGFPERLFNEFKTLIPSEVKKKIHKPVERNISCWLGGSILTALNSFRKMWITKGVSLESKISYFPRNGRSMEKEFCSRDPFEGRESEMYDMRVYFECLVTSRILDLFLSLNFQLFLQNTTGILHGHRASEGLIAPQKADPAPPKKESYF